MELRETLFDNNVQMGQNECVNKRNERANEYVLHFGNKPLQICATGPFLLGKLFEMLYWMGKWILLPQCS